MKEVFTELEELIVDLMRQSKIPGLSIGVVLNGESVYARGFGARNLEKNLPMTPDTLWGIASISKSFCALSIMQLVEKGKISLDDPVSKYINFKLGSKDKPITIHHLLCHSSGLPELDATTSATEKETFIPMSSKEDFLTFINKARTEIFAEPGKVFMYNNDMYTCLGLIIEEVTKTKYAEYVKENVLKPLEMNRSTFYLEEIKKEPDAISGYKLQEGEKPLTPTDIKSDELDYACGGLYSSVRELQNYMIALMNGGKFKDRQIIQKESIEKMWKPHIKCPIPYGKSGYGYGWGIEENFFGYKLVHHGGNITTSGGFLAMIPEKNMGVVIGQIPNPTGAHEMITRGILAKLLGQDLNKAVPMLEVHKKLELIQGKYKAYGAVELQVTFENGILYGSLAFAGEKPIKLPLAVENLDKLKFKIPALFPEMSTEIQFIIDKKTKKVHAQADRYYFHKI